jgi:hypothetical protein
MDLGREAEAKVRVRRDHHAMQAAHDPAAAAKLTTPGHRRNHGRLPARDPI